MNPKKSSKTTKVDEVALATFVRSINLAKTMNECLWVGDKDHKTLYVNPMFERLSGYSLEECVGRDCDFWFDEKGKKTIAEHHKLRKKGKASEYEAIMVSKSGEKIPLWISGAPTKMGGTIGVFMNLTDVKKLAEKDRIASQIIHNSTEAIVILDEESKIKMWNMGATRLFGYKEEEVLNKNIGIIIPDDEKELSSSFLAEVDEKGHLRYAEVTRMTKKGARIDVSISITKVSDDNNKKFLGYLVVYTDISHQKQTSAELQKRFEVIQDSYKELGLHRRQVDYFNEISTLAVTDASLTALANLIVSAISLLTKSDAAVLRLYDKKKDALRLKACVGVSAGWWNKDQIQYKNSIAQKAFAEKRALIVDNVGQMKNYKGAKLLKEHGFKTMISIPLFVEEECIGSLNIYVADSAKLRSIETDFLENFGRQCAISLFVKMHKDNL